MENSEMKTTTQQPHPTNKIGTIWWRKSYRSSRNLFCIFAIVVASTSTLTSQFSSRSNGQMVMLQLQLIEKSSNDSTSGHPEATEGRTVGSRYTTSDLATRTQQLFNNELENIETATSKEESIRFVVFLGELKNYPAAVTLLQSLSESKNSTSIPPLVMMTKGTVLPIQEKEFLESLGAEVMNATVPEDLKEVCRRVGKSWWSFEKTLLFRSELMKSDIVLYMNVDAIVRGDVIDCMGEEIINPLRSRQEVDIVAVRTGPHDGFNSGVLLVRPKHRTYKYMLKLIENGPCYGQNASQRGDGCTADIAMNRKFGMDQTVFHEYTQRFPDRLQNLRPDSPFNLRPMHSPNDRAQNCSIVHYIGWPRPAEIWFEGRSMAQVSKELPILSIGPSLPHNIQEFATNSKSSTEWGLRAWRDQWNDAVISKRPSHNKVSATASEKAAPLSSSAATTATSLLKEATPQGHQEESIRFVLFLINAKYFSGAVAAVHSLAASAVVTSKPPLVMIMSNDTLQGPQQAFLEHLGAEVLHVTVPQDLKDAMRVHKVGDRWKGVFTKMLFFNRKLVNSDIVFYIDTDAVARGNLTSCMSSTINKFRENPKLDILAAGDRKYFNNGVMLARARDRTYDSMVELLRNGTCYGQSGCANRTTQMNRKIATDQDIFVEYTSRFPDRYEPINPGDPFNLRPMHALKDRNMNCSIVHYTGHPKPWSAWFEGENMSNVATMLPQVPLNDTSILPIKIQTFLNGSKSSREWSMRLWGNIWNDAVQKWQAVNLN